MADTGEIMTTTVVGASPTVSSARIYAVCMLALVANAVAKAVYAAMAPGVVGAATQGFGLSWAFWLAYAMCLRLAITAEPRLATRTDWLVGAACVAAAAAPIGPVSSAAATALGLWLLVRPSSDVRLKAAALVLLAITVNLLWGPLLMRFFAAPVAAVDAHLVGLVDNTPVHANMVRLLDGSHQMSIVEGCTSVGNASVALMMFVAIVRTFRPAPRLSELAYLGVVFALVVAINDVRLSLMARSLAMFELVHGPSSWAAINLIFTAVGVLGAALCVRREILA